MAEQAGRDDHYRNVFFKGIRPKLIAVDTFNLALDGNEDSSEEVKKAIAGARALGVMFDAGVLIELTTRVIPTRAGSAAPRPKRQTRMV